MVTKRVLSILLSYLHPERKTTDGENLGFFQGLEGLSQVFRTRPSMTTGSHCERGDGFIHGFKPLDFCNTMLQRASPSNSHQEELFCDLHASGKHKQLVLR